MNGIHEFLEEYHLHLDPSSRYIDFMSEAGQLGTAILNTTDYGTKPLELNEDLKKEAGDTLFALLAFLSECGLDAEELSRETLMHYRKRMEEYTESQ